MFLVLFVKRRMQDWIRKCQKEKPTMDEINSLIRGF
jgi:hypothetical protein